MQRQTIRIEGKPATWATRREREWKSTLAAQIPPPMSKGRESGLMMRFFLPTLAPQGQPLDVDNLVEPVLAVLVGQSRWFEGSRSRIQWWSATKEVGDPCGCILTISSAARVPVPAAAATRIERYEGVFPKSATSRDLAAWAFGVVEREPHLSPSSCALYLGFGSPSVNIGDISTGVVKPFVDCLYPFFGGRAGAPEDHRIARLIVERAVPGLLTTAVRVDLWYDGVLTTPSVHRPARGRAPAPRENGLVRNPCRPGTAKWVVYEGAVEGKDARVVRAELEQVKPGSGQRLAEYLSDLRSENAVDVRIEGTKLILRGPRRGT